MKYMAILLAVLAILVPASVSADIEYFDGIPIDMPDNPDDYARVLDSINQGWLPPAPPNAGNAEGWTLDTYEFELGINMPVEYKNQDSGPSIAEVLSQDLIEYDWTGQEIWQYT